MRFLFLLLVLIIISCQGRLTEEQKKELKEGMDANQIVKISDAEIVEAAFQYGRDLAEQVRALPSLNDKRLVNLQDEFQVKIYSLATGDSLLLQIEQELIEAYTSARNIDLSDNIQKIGKDSLLYTMPIMDTLADGSLEFKYALGIRMPKKRVIQSIKK